MNCLSDDAIGEFLDGHQDPKKRAEVIEHLDACPECRQLISNITQSQPIQAPSVPRPLPLSALDKTLPDVKSIIGRLVGNFRVESFIGAGSMGAVFSGVHVLLGHRVAIKVMQLDRIESNLYEQAVERFITEAKALTEIKDLSHIIQLFDFGRLEEGLFYYVMEYLEGHTLEKELQRKILFSPREALPYLEQICAGLEAAHRCNVLHRDLKPANIFVLRPERAQPRAGEDEAPRGWAQPRAGEDEAPRGWAQPRAGEDDWPLRLKLIDFGLAKRLGVQSSATQGALGSPLYASPELVTGRQDSLGPQSDIYSLGVILYRMLSGQMPYDLSVEMSPIELFLLPTRTDSIPLAARLPSISAPVAQLVQRCLSRKALDRPSSARAVYSAFEQAIGERPKAAAEIFRPEKKPRVSRLIKIALASAVLVAAGLWIAAYFLTPKKIPAPVVHRPPAAPQAAGLPSADLLRALGAEVFVSSRLRSKFNKPEHLVDGRMDTAWNSGPGDLEGAWIAFRLPIKARVSAILLTVGFTKRDGARELFFMNHRVSQVKVLRDNKPLGEYSLDIANRDLQRIPIDGPGGEYRIIVLATVPGTKTTWREICISELRVPGDLPPGLVGGDHDPMVKVGYDLQQAIAILLSDSMAPERTVAQAKAFLAKLGEPSRRQIARALNTRGYRQYRAGDHDAALKLLQASAEMQSDYGMPRYNSARIYAIKGDVENCVRYLLEIKQLDQAQRERLNQALKDDGFKRVWNEPRFKAVFEHGPAKP